jgi:hypothetical protein
MAGSSQRNGCGLGGVWLTLMALGCACGGDAATADEAARDAGADAALAPFAELPDFLPCRPGWRELERAGVTVCEPWPEGGRQQCGVDSAHFVGGAGCERLGSDCPTGDWADDLVDRGDIIFVRAGATNGDGRRDAPFGSISAATARSHVGTTIALAKGTYREWVDLPAGVTLWGACVAETVIEAPRWRLPPTSEPVGAIIAWGVGGTVVNLRVAGERPGLLVSPRASLFVTGVVVDSPLFAGVGVFGELTADGLVVRDARPDAEGNGGFGLWVRGGRASLRRTVLEGSASIGIAATGVETELELVDVAVLDTRRPRPGESAPGGAGPSPYGLGVLVDRASRVEATGLVLEGHTSVSIYALEVTGAARLPTGPALRLSDAVIRAMPPNEPWTLPFGLLARDAWVEVDRLFVHEARGLAAIGVGDRALAVLRDILVEQTRTYVENGLGDPPAPIAMGGSGLVVSGAEVRLHRAVLRDSTSFGMQVAGPPAVVSARDVIVSGTAASPELGHGTAVGTYLGAAVDFSRFVISDNALLGVQIASGGTVDLYDGAVLRNVIGVNIQTEDFDLQRLENNVRYLENDRNFDSDSLPLPDLDRFSLPTF